jgi:hypothetical protein
MDRLRMAKVSLASAGMQSKIIHSDDFCQYVREHGRAAVGRRLTSDALWFIQDYVFPPSHADLLSVRGTYTKHSVKEEAEAPDAEESEQNGE